MKRVWAQAEAERALVRLSSCQRFSLRERGGEREGERVREERVREERGRGGAGGKSDERKGKRGRRGRERERDANKIWIEID